MSTRRTTRATSKAASSRGASPALVEMDIPPTPAGRRSSRKTGSLPAVPTRASTAYGTNSTLQPTFLNRPEISQPLDSVLSGLLEPVREEGARSVASTNRGGRAPASRGPRGVRGGRRTASATPATDRSFFNESGIFGDAGIESSIASSELGGIPEVPEPPIFEPVASRRMTQREREQSEQEQVLREIARNPVAGRAHQQATAAASSLSQYMAQSLEIGSALASNIKLFLYWILAQVRSPLGVLCMSTFGIVALSLLAFSSGGIQWYGLDFRHNIGQFIPFSVAHPTSYFNPNEIKQLQIRISKAEYDIVHLKQRSDLDEKAISKLEQILPDFVVCKKDKGGNLQITQEFWHALDAKMRSEGAYLQHQVTVAPPKESSTTDITVKQIESILEKSKVWDKFLNSNRAKIMAWSGEELNNRFPKKLKDSIADAVVVSKPEFLDAIRHNWEKSQKEIRSEVQQLTKKLDGTVHHIENGISGHTMEEVKDISIVAATDVFKKLFSIAQLEALAKANQKINVNNNAHRLNHFSPGTGAVINPRLTSPDFAFPTMNRNLLVRAFMKLIQHSIPSPNSPKVALERWEEHGDCWCSPSKDNGYGPSLAVIMGNNIYPDEVIIEHIPTTAALEPGATPKDMELLAYIDDRGTYDTIKKRSYDLFQEEAMEDEQHPIGYVRIGTWTYDAESLSYIQSFPLQIDLKFFQAPTNRLILRAKTNWGGDKVDFTCLYRVRVNGEIVRPTA